MGNSEHGTTYMRVGGTSHRPLLPSLHTLLPHHRSQAIAPLEIDILLPHDQRQHHTLHIQKHHTLQILPHNRSTYHQLPLHASTS